MSEQLRMDEMFGGMMGEPHLACVLLLDVSGSMAGDAIKSLNKSVERFKNQVCKDETAKRRVDVAIVSFGSQVFVEQDFLPIAEMGTIKLKAAGRTSMAEGIQKAIDLVKDRQSFYQQIGVPYFKPWIFMVTDGCSTSSEYDMQQAAQRIYQEETKGSVGRLKFWAVGVDDYDKTQLFQLTRRVVELKTHNFTGIFDWLSESMTTISHSQVGENVELDMLPEDARKAREDRKIDEDW